MRSRIAAALVLIAYGAALAGLVGILAGCTTSLKNNGVVGCRYATSFELFHDTHEASESESTLSTPLIGGLGDGASANTENMTYEDPEVLDSPVNSATTADFQLPHESEEGGDGGSEPQPVGTNG